MQRTGSPLLERRLRAAAISSWSSARARPWSCASHWRRATSGGIAGWWKTREKSRPAPSSARCRLAHVEQVGAADHLVERAEAELRHDLAHFLGDEEEDS